MGRLNWNRRRSGGGQISSLRGEARQAAGFGLRYRPQWGTKKPTTKAGKIKRILRNARALLAAKKGIEINKAIYGERKAGPPKGCIRLAKEDPVTHVVNTVDLPLTMLSYGKLLDKIAKKKPLDGYGALTEDHMEFIRTGRWNS